jgi:hypothetical protein
MRTLIAGLTAGLAMNLAMLLTFRLVGFGWNGGGILLTSPIQSKKLIAVWTQLEPLPLVVTKPAPIIAGLLLFGVGLGLIYRWLSVAWPPGIVPRALRMGGLLFFMSFVFWEFFTPFNQFGEPLALIAMELIFWAVIAFAAAFSIAGISERGEHGRRRQRLA